MAARAPHAHIFFLDFSDLPSVCSGWKILNYWQQNIIENWDQCWCIKSNGNCQGSFLLPYVWKTVLSQMHAVYSCFVHGRTEINMSIKERNFQGYGRSQSLVVKLRYSHVILDIVKKERPFGEGRKGSRGRRTGWRPCGMRSNRSPFPTRQGWGRG